ncbi:hypothetical protein AVEN_249780-1 [Araneus ventricosus]|uniref:HTH psq-type domain-containing protein n=1 Tax=Araneus ventricosus TaxID=182803 RepID=A0A4Y2C7F8_ARAVE|nr:hypothetical protein AVEN_249780-1 [Araneus ventricosus]
MDVIIYPSIDRTLKVTFGGTIPTAGSADILSRSPLLSEIPFVSTTICLSIDYFLSDSEALALLKCRTFIYAMEPTKRKRVLLTVEQKFKIVTRIEACETRTQLSKEFGAGVSTVDNMRRDSEKIKKFYAASNGKSAELQKTMKCANNEELDNALYKWFI